MITPRNLLTFLAFVSLIKANAQIHVNIEPEFTNDNESTIKWVINPQYDMDYDLGLKHHFVNWDNIYLTFMAMDSTEIAVTPGNENYVAVIERGTLISKDLKWKEGTDLKMGEIIAKNVSGTWPGVRNKYVAYRLNQSDGYHYGWLEVTVNALVRAYTLYNNAFEMTPNKPIGAGQVDYTGVNDAKPSFFNITKQEKSWLIEALSMSQLTATMVNMSGQVVLTQTALDGRLNLDFSALPQGIYTVLLTHKEGQQALKLAKSY